MDIKDTVARIRATFRSAFRLRRAHGGEVSPRARDDDSIPAFLSEGYCEVDEATRRRFGDDLLRQMDGRASRSSRPRT